MKSYSDRQLQLLQTRLIELDRENQRLREENERLRKLEVQEAIENKIPPRMSKAKLDKRATGSGGCDAQTKLNSDEFLQAEAIASRVNEPKQIQLVARSNPDLQLAPALLQAEQERATELAKANASLRECVSRLVDEPNSELFLNHILLEASAQINADAAALFLYDKASHTRRLKCYVQAGEVLPIATTPDLAHLKTPVPRDSVNFWETEPFKGEAVLLNLDDCNEQICTRLDWHRCKGHRSIVRVPLVLGSCPIGFIGFCFQEPQAKLPQNIDLVMVLAQQATLAIRLAQLLEEVEQATIAREQEKATLERVAELARANDALKRSLDALATEPDLNKFVGQVLNTIAQQFQSPLTGYWSHREDTAYIELLHWQGQILDRAAIAQIFPLHGGLEGFKVPAAMIGCESLQQRKRYFIHDSATNPFTKDLDFVTKELLPRELSQELNVPLVLGDRCLGALSIHLPQERQFTSQQVELAQPMAHQVTLAVEMTRLAEEVKQAAILGERNRLAQEIHDTLAQAFTGIVIQLEAAKGIVTTQPEDALKHLARANALAREGLGEARRSVQALRPSVLQSSDLPTALSQFVQHSTADTAVQAEVCVAGTPYALSAEVETNLFRIGQEALTNVLRHAQAQTVYLQLCFESQSVQLNIRDDGRGFDPQRPSAGHGFGLMGMQERSQRLHGTFTLDSKVGEGTHITVTVPTQRS